MAHYQTRRLLLRPAATLDAIVRYASSNGWQRIATMTGDPNQLQPDEIVWRAGPSLKLHYCQDRITSNRYLCVSGGHRQLAESMLGMTERELEVWTTAELIQEFDNATDVPSRADALIRLLLAAPTECDRGIYRRVQSALADPAEKLRDLAIWSISYSPWPEFRVLLRHVAAEDASGQIRAKAMRMIESFDAAEVAER